MTPESPKTGPAPVLVLGGGRNQVSLICHIESRGIPVLVADYLPHSPGHAIASHSSFVSTFDSEGAIRLAREYGIRGVITTGTDQPLVTMADVADAMNLPCYLSPTQARLCTDKLPMLSAFRDAGLPVPRYRVIDPAQPAAGQADDLRPPLVVKPVDSQGQRGISVLREHDDLPRAIVAARSASRGGHVIVQEFISGPEVTITGWVRDGRFQLGSVTDRHTYNRPPATGVCFQHVYPSRHAAAHHARFRELAESIADVFGLVHGPLYIQCIVADDSIWLVEATCRLGGGHEALLVEHATGLHFDSQLLSLCLTGSCPDMPDLPPFPVPGCYNLITFLLASPGVFHRIELPQPGNGLLAAGCYHRPGFRQDPIVDGQGRVGYLHCAGDNRERMLQNAAAAYARSHILDEGGNDLLFWPTAENLNL